MRFVERLGRKPHGESTKLEPETLAPIIDKLLDDLRHGFIIEDYNGDPKEESLLYHEGYCVVLKRRNRFRSSW